MTVADVREQALTDVEEDVLDWLACGYTHEQTARLLRMPASQVLEHERVICDKLRVRSRLEAVREAMRHGWLVA